MAVVPLENLCGDRAPGEGAPPFVLPGITTTEGAPSLRSLQGWVPRTCTPPIFGGWPSLLFMNRRELAAPAFVVFRRLDTACCRFQEALPAWHHVARASRRSRSCRQRIDIAIGVGGAHLSKTAKGGAALCCWSLSRTKPALTDSDLILVLRISSEECLDFNLGRFVPRVATAQWQVKTSGV